MACFASTTMLYILSYIIINAVLYSHLTILYITDFNFCFCNFCFPLSLICLEKDMFIANESFALIITGYVNCACRVKAYALLYM